jgi:hypothetical protein
MPESPPPQFQTLGDVFPVSGSSRYQSVLQRAYYSFQIPTIHVILSLPPRVEISYLEGNIPLETQVGGILQQ